MYKFLSNVLNVPFIDGKRPALHARMLLLNAANGIRSRLPSVPRDASFNVDAAAIVSKISELGRCIVYAPHPKKSRSFSY